MSILDRIRSPFRPAGPLCTFHRPYGELCGRPESDKGVHVAENERMRPGCHVYRHEPSKRNAAPVELDGGPSAYEDATRSNPEPDPQPYDHGDGTL